MLSRKRDNKMATQDSREVRRDEQSAVWCARERTDQSPDFGGAFDGKGNKLESERPSSGISRPPVVAVGACLGIKKDRHPHKISARLL